MSSAEDNIRGRLFELRDEQYGDFQCRLTPAISRENVIGVRTPQLRRLAKELYGSADGEEFLLLLPHRYYDENNLHGFLVSQIKDYGAAQAAVDRFLPYVDNWATCDLMSPRAFKKRPPELPEKIREWTASGRTYTVRFGIEMLMSLYLDGDFRPEYPELVAELRFGEYYVNMMIAWYFATALAKQWDCAVQYIEGGRLDRWTHNKSIQKALESFRVSDGHKAYLRTLKIK